MKQPNLDSAAVTARVISKILRKHGFEKADSAGNRYWTKEGYFVHRVGFGSTVHVGYHVLETYPHHHTEYATRWESEIAQMREVPL